MAILKVLKHPDPKLRKTAEKVTDFNDELNTIIANMLETMDAEKGIGLAATQVDIHKQIITINTSKEGKEEENKIIINPQVISKGDTIETTEEGCLSIPGVHENVNRPNKIHIKYQDKQGNDQELHASGLLAVCIQHEIDHLNGVLFIDHLSIFKRKKIEKQYKKISENRE